MTISAKMTKNNNFLFTATCEIITSYIENNKLQNFLDRLLIVKLPDIFSIRSSGIVKEFYNERLNLIDYERFDLMDCLRCMYT